MSRLVGTCAADRGNVISYLASADAALSVLCALNTLHSFLVTMSSVREMSDVVPLPANRFPPRPQKAMAGVTQARGYYTGPKFHPGQGWGHTLPSTGHRRGIATGEMGTHMSGTLLTGGTCEYMSGTHVIIIRGHVCTGTWAAWHR